MVRDRRSTNRNPGSGIDGPGSMVRAPSVQMRRQRRIWQQGGRELRALRRLRREQEPQSPFVFSTERAGPFTTAGFRKMVARLGAAAKFDFRVHPHMLRHACGYKLANDGVDTRSLQAYLGHKNIQHTVRYTELAPTRFKGFWED
jgi:site-specific recombinase XerD